MNKKKADTKNLAIKLRATTLQGEIYIKGQYCYRNIEKLIIEQHHNHFAFGGNNNFFSRENGKYLSLS